MGVPSHIGIMKNKKAYNYDNHAMILITKKQESQSIDDICHNMLTIRHNRGIYKIYYTTYNPEHVRYTQRTKPL